MTTDKTEGLSARLRAWSQNSPDPDYFQGDVLSSVLGECGDAADALDANDKLLAFANAEVSAMREFVKRHPAFSLIDLAEFEAFVAFPKLYAELEAHQP